MGDGGIVVVTLTGGKGDDDRLAAIADQASEADVLEIHATGSIPARTLRQVSELAEANDLTMRFEPTEGGH